MRTQPQARSRLRGMARARFAVFVLGALLGVGCSADSTPSRPAATGPAPDGDTAEAGAMPAATTAAAAAERPITLGRPVTLRLEPPPELLESVRGLGSGEGPPPTLRLTLEGLERPAQAEVTIRAFVNRPEASLATPIDAPGHVGDVGFFPTTSSVPGGEAESTFLLDLGQALAELPAGERLVEGRYIDVTLVAVPMRDAGLEAAGEVEIPFEGVRLSLHPPG